MDCWTVGLLKIIIIQKNLELCRAWTVGPLDYWTIEYSFTILLCISYVVHSVASLPNISMEDFLYLRNYSTELQILVDSLTWFEVLKNVGLIKPKTTLHRLDSKTFKSFIS